MKRPNGVLTFLGLDPGLASTGYAVAEADIAKREIVAVNSIGVIKTEPQTQRQVRKTSDDLRRAQIQAKELSRLISEHGVNFVAMEMSSTTPYTLPTFSFGVMIGVAAGFTVPIVQVLPHEVKQAATGNPRATKGDVISWALKQAGSGQLAWPTSSRANKLNLLQHGRNVAPAAEHPADALAAIQASLATPQIELLAAAVR